MRPADASIPRLMSDYRIDRLGIHSVTGDRSAGTTQRLIGSHCS